MTIIESSERGITLSKPLAWTMLVALIGGGIWVGSQIGSLAEVRNQVARNTAEIAAIASTQRVAAVDSARSAEKMSAILDGVRRIEVRMDRLEQESRRNSMPGVDQ